MTTTTLLSLYNQLARNFEKWILVGSFKSIISVRVK